MYITAEGSLEKVAEPNSVGVIPLENVVCNVKLEEIK